MNRLERLKARTLSRYVQIETSRSEPLLFLFKIIKDGQEIRVSLNHKGWICDAIENLERYERKCLVAARRGKEKPIKWNHVLNKGKECEHILACKIFLKKMKGTDVLERIGVKHF